MLLATSVVAMAKRTAKSHDVPQPLRAQGSEFVVKVGDEAPHFSVTTFGGDELDSDFLRDQVTLIQFASTWCRLSKDQLKDTELLWRELSSGGDFMVLVFDEEDSPADTLDFIRRSEADELTMPMAYDAQERVYQLFATPHGSVTRSIVIDAEGKIAMLSDTYHTSVFEQIKKRIVELIDEKHNK